MKTEAGLVKEIYESKVESIQNLAYVGCWATLLYTLSLTDKQIHRIIQRKSRNGFALMKERMGM